MATLEGELDSNSFRPFEMVSKLCGLTDAPSNVVDSLDKGKFGDLLRRSPFAKGVRVAMLLSSMLPSMAEGKPVDKADLEKGGQVIQSMVYAAQKSMEEQLKDFLKMPKEEHMNRLRQIKIAAEKMRPKEDANDVEKAAFDIVLANVLEPRTANLFKAMHQMQTLSEAELQVWFKGVGVKSDFGELYESEVMNDEQKLNEFTTAVRRLYRHPEIQNMQWLAGDTRLLPNYEVVFSSMKGMGDYTDAEKRAASEELLKDGNLEELVKILRASNARLYVEQTVGFLEQYLPPEKMTDELRKGISLLNDPGHLELKK